MRIFKAIVVTIFVVGALNLFLLVSAEASCWTIPSDCYSVDLHSGVVSLSIRGEGHGMRYLTLYWNEKAAGAAKPVQKEKPMLCFERAKPSGDGCIYYFMCKPINYKHPLQLNMDSTNFLEVIWATKSGAEEVKRGSFRHNFQEIAKTHPVGKWHGSGVTFGHWGKKTSGAPSCRDRNVLQKSGPKVKAK